MKRSWLRTPFGTEADGEPKVGVKRWLTVTAAQSFLPVPASGDPAAAGEGGIGGVGGESESGAAARIDGEADAVAKLAS